MMPKETGMIHQLRIYEIFERNKAAFHARFRDEPLLLVCELAKRAFAAQQPTLIFARDHAQAEALYLAAGYRRLAAQLPKEGAVHPIAFAKDIG